MIYFSIDLYTMNPKRPTKIIFQKKKPRKFKNNIPRGYRQKQIRSHDLPESQRRDHQINFRRGTHQKKN